MDLPTSHHNSSSANNNNKGSNNHNPPTTTNIATRDSVYCLELAKRSVARAALHLGIPSMTQDTLSVLGDVLCSYLERLASVLAQNVEASGRSSQHVNSLDVLRAVELCTSPAVNRVHFTTSSGSRGTDENGGTGNPLVPSENINGHKTTNHHNNHPPHSPGSWQGLAAFCFGPTWQDTAVKELEVAELQGAGGKVGPKADVADTAEKDCQEGWRAPYPDEVPPFPTTVSANVRNPHAMSHAQVLTALYGKQPPPPDNCNDDLLRGPDLISAEGASRERRAMETKLGQVPVSAWGGISNQKKTPEETQEANNNTSAKRKLQDDDDKGDDAADQKEEAKDDGKDGDKMDVDDDKKDKKDKDNDSAQPPKKKVKLEDGSAKPKTPPKKKKAAAKKKDDEAKERETKEEANKPAEEPVAAAAKTHGHNNKGPTYDYVPTFLPPIPNMSALSDAHKLRKTTVVDWLQEQPMTKSRGTVDKNTHSLELRSALVQLGTRYWGSLNAEDDARSSETVEAVPVGRNLAGVPAAAPIQPLGRASGSRVSRILEGSMDAATMQQ